MPTLHHFDYAIPIPDFLHLWMNESINQNKSSTRTVLNYMQRNNVPIEQFNVHKNNIYLTTTAIQCLQPKIDMTAIYQYRHANMNIHSLLQSPKTHSSPHVPHTDTSHHLETVPNHVVHYMDILARTYKDSKDPKVLSQMLESDQASHISQYLASSRQGTLTRSSSIASKQPLSFAIKMDPFTEELVQWLFQVADEKPEPFPSLAAAVRSGNILFSIAKYMLTKPPQSKYLHHETQYSVHKIIYFFDCCRIVGVPDELIFPFTILMVDDDDPRPISRTLIEFEKCARRKAGSSVRWPPIPIPNAGYFSGNWSPQYQIMSDSNFSLTSQKNNPNTFPPIDTNGSKSTEDESVSIYNSSNASSVSPTKQGMSSPVKPTQQNTQAPQRTAQHQDSSKPSQELKPALKQSSSISNDLDLTLKSLMYQEELYLQDLQLVVDWMHVLKDARPAEDPITSLEYKVLFGNICALRDLHENLFKAMRSYDRVDSTKTQVEAVALSILRSASDLLREYEAHAMNSKHVTTLIDQNVDRPLLRRMLDDFSKWPKGHGLSLESYLAQPGEHLLVYARKLSDLKSNGADGPNVRKATEVLKSMIQSIEKKRSLVHGNNARSRISSYLVPMVVDNQDTMSEDVGHGTPTLRRNLNQAVDIATLESASRRFICQGSVWEVVHVVEVKVRSLLLFHDALIIAKEVPPNQFEVRTILDLRNIIIRPTRDCARSALRLRPVVAEAVTRFNQDPFAALNDLIRQKVLDISPNNAASFLHKTPNLSRRQVGNYIGHEDNLHVAVSYAAWYAPVFAHIPFEDALRLFLSSVRFGNDGQAIDRVLSAFAKTYRQANIDHFNDEQDAIDLVFATVLLNADMHGAGGGAVQLDAAFLTNSLQAFIDSNPGVNTKYSRAVFQSIQSEKLTMASDRSPLVVVDVLTIPTHLTLNEPTDWLEISIPASDPLVTLRMLATPALSIEPAIIAFSESDTAFIRITATQTGRHRMYFLLGGDSASRYEYIMPLTIVVEAPYMKHTFSIEFPRTTESNQDSKRSSLTFSVASDDQRQRWVSYLTNAIDRLQYTADSSSS